MPFARNSSYRRFALTSGEAVNADRPERQRREHDAAWQARHAKREAQHARMVTTEDLGLADTGDETCNGPGFTPLSKTENFASIKTAVSKMSNRAPVVNETFGTKLKVRSGGDVKKLAWTTGSEDERAHQYAAKNVLTLATQARVAVRQDNYKPDHPHKTFNRLLAPYVFEGRLYVAVIAQYEADVNGVHAVEALDVVRADTSPEVTSSSQNLTSSPTGAYHALDTITIPNEGPNDNTLSLKTGK